MSQIVANISSSASSSPMQQTNHLGVTVNTVDITKTNPYLRSVLIFIYALIFVMGVCGNSLVVFVVVRRKAMQTITNLFIANLALSDILMSCVATPFTPFAVFSEDWFLPSILCKILPMTMGVSVYVSTLTSTAIAVDRYFVIVNPFVERMKKWLCGMVIVYVWIVGIFISLPLAVYQKKEPRQVFSTVGKVIPSGGNHTPSVCLEKWPKASSREVFTITSFCMQFIIPCCIIIYCYRQVSLVLVRRCNMKIGSSTTPNRRREVSELRRKHRTNKMLIAMIAIFVLCWTPLNIWWIVNDILQAIQQSNVPQKSNISATFSFIESTWLNNSSNLSRGTIIKYTADLSHSTGSSRVPSAPLSTRQWPYHNLIFLICHILAMSSTLYNPFLYAGLNENFLAEFRNVFPCLFRRFHTNTPQSTDGGGMTDLLPLAQSGANYEPLHTNRPANSSSGLLIPRDRPVVSMDLKLLTLPGK